MHMIIWFRQRDQLGHLFFALAATSAAMIGVFEWLLMKAPSPEQFGWLLRMAHPVVACWYIALIVFTLVYLRAGRVWLGLTIVVVRLAVLVLNSAAEVNFNYLEIHSLRTIRLLGEPISVVESGIPNPMMRVGELSSLLLFIFFLDATVTLYRRGQRSQALLLGTPMVLMLTIAAVHAGLLHNGVFTSPYIISLSSCLVVAAMGYEMTTGVLRTSQLGRELQVKQRELMESEQRLQLAVSAANIGLWTWDIDRDDIWGTQQARHMFHFDSSSRISLRDFIQRLHRDDQPVVEQAVRQTVSQGTQFEHEYRVMAPDGSERWLAARARLDRNDQGQAYRMSGVVLDITQRKRSEQWMRAVMDTTCYALVIMDTEGRIVSVNARAREMFALPVGDLAGQPAELLICERDRIAFRRCCQLALGGHGNESSSSLQEWCGRRMDGQEIPIEVGLGVVRKEGADFVVVSAVDITVRRRAQLETVRQRNELAHLSRVNVMGELSTSLAHELNQPLASILSNAQAALRFFDQTPPDLAEVREILKDIVEQDKRAGEVIRRLRLLLRKGEVQDQPLDLNEAILDVINLAHSDLINHGVVARMDLANNLPQVRGDRVQLQQVLLNLIINACDSMEHVPRDRRHLDLRTRCQDGQVQVEISDTGRGIPVEMADHIFEPFVTTKPNGMGLGLAVCQTIIQAHHGKLSFIPNPAAGATFCFALPLQKEDVT
jgi:PAS domain S-box-containing protein